MVINLFKQDFLNASLNLPPLFPAPIHRLLQSHFGTSYRCTDEVKEIIVDACKGEISQKVPNLT